jgi:micrococcal nuclease
MYEYKAKVTRVVDGDTVDALIDCGFSVFRKERIRLYGINAPESRTRDKEEKKRGLAAKARLKELIKEGKNQVIVRTEIDKKGKFGRLLGKLYNDNVDQYKTYNEILVDEGHAVEYFGKKR